MVAIERENQSDRLFVRRELRLFRGDCSVAAALSCFMHISATHTSPKNVTDSHHTCHNMAQHGATCLALQLADGGAIINISTSLTRHVAAGSLAYAAMKSALETATRYLALELGPRGIAVNSAAPGATETDFFGGAVRDVNAVNQYVAQHTAMGRTGRPDDIGKAVAILLAGSGRWITGQRIEASRGMLL